MLSKPEKGKAVENMLVQMAQRGQIGSKVYWRFSIRYYQYTTFSYVSHLKCFISWVKARWKASSRRSINRHRRRPLWRWGCTCIELSCLSLRRYWKNYFFFKFDRRRAALDSDDDDYWTTLVWLVFLFVCCDSVCFFCVPIIIIIIILCFSY